MVLEQIKRYKRWKLVSINLQLVGYQTQRGLGKNEED
jgi:hypothetical protein